MKGKHSEETIEVADGIFVDIDKDKRFVSLELHNISKL
ncbi:MAG: DUF2283 domain-containing protein [Candidatus Peribacteraceae bacterium]|nr:DUF2283 domain-containing protein [Candidatus Peribacteraceae bacterium]